MTDTRTVCSSAFSNYSVSVSTVVTDTEGVCSTRPSFFQAEFSEPAVQQTCLLNFRHQKTLFVCIGRLSHMVHARRASLYPILGGVGATLLSFAGYGVENTPLTPGQPEFVTAILLVVCLGFVVTGWLWRRELDSGEQQYRRVPPLTVGVVAVCSIIGSLLIFQPWTSRGFARVFLTAITGVLSILGGALGLSSIIWYRQQAVRTPLAVLASILSVGLFHRYAQTFDPNIPVPIVALVVVIIGAVPFVSVWYAVPSHSAV
jgi:hypothetical protein